ncbi:MAG: TetR/AcrR family transcriptional regulator [Lachnospiraceae bacterium]|nr:TetR/AcrR family transcriptional regulator [Lachnospiraceae bacterium]
MARKETITMDTILDTAFAMTREEGFSNVTARKVAVKAGCSTQPIFRVYKNMEELWDAVYLRAVTFFQDYYGLYPKTGRVPFANLGMAYIAFAREEKHLFELLFLTQKGQGNAGNQEQESTITKSMYEILNGNSGNVVYEINLARVQGCANPSDIFMKMWIFIHGAACMTLTGDYDLSDVETKEMLEQSYRAFSGTQ